MRPLEGLRLLGVQHSPHGVLVGGWQLGAGHRRTVVGAHYAFCQQKVTEQTRHQQVLSEQLLEQICKQKVHRLIKKLIIKDIFQRNNCAY